MTWWKRLLGFSSPKQKLEKKLKKLHQQSFNAQRKGDLSLAGKYQLEAEKVMDAIIALELEVEK
tara:strand:- start:5 stop:196 length:192 start_codon:yes stop_codon:yes gene_type:complete